MSTAYPAVGRGALRSYRGRGGGWLLPAIAVAALAAVGVALVSQYRFDLQPCPWCVLQRLILVVIAAVALVGSFGRRSFARQAAAALVEALAACGAAAALWQHFKAAASASCNLTFADRLISGLRLDAALPAVFEPRASCADAAVNLLGVPYDFWSLALFLVIAVAGLNLFRQPRSS